MIRNRACEYFSLGIRQQDREFLQRTRQRAIQHPDGWYPGENKRAVPRRRHLNQNFFTKKHEGGSNVDHTIRTCSICAMALRNSAASWAALGLWAWSMHRTSIHTTVSRPSFSVLGQHYAREHVSIRKKTKSPAKLANSTNRFFPSSIVRMAHHDGGAANKASRPMQLLHKAPAHHVVFATCQVTDHIACNLRKFG
jgi:hypothetical protein